VREQFTFTNMQEGTNILKKISQINKIIAEYAKKGIRRLTVRQLHYQLVSRGLYPNTKRTYILTGEAATIGRDQGLIDWKSIEDRSRELTGWTTWKNPAEAIANAAEYYNEDYWERGQRYRPEVWIEKEALVGIIENICSKLLVPFFAAHGYSSTTCTYEAGKRFAYYRSIGKIPVVLYLGDHDPSGIHMGRDIEKRVSLYARAKIEVRRVALNMDQVKQYRPPPNEIKDGDKRSPAYVEEFGTEKCWELDALDPDVLVQLVKKAVEKLIDKDRWSAAQDHSEQNREKIEEIAAEHEYDLDDDDYDDDVVEDDPVVQAPVEPVKPKATKKPKAVARPKVKPKRKK
jgi:hypothetical protein